MAIEDNRTLGPTIPFMFLDKQLDDDKDYGLSIFKPMNTDAWMKWLNMIVQKGQLFMFLLGVHMAAFEVEQMEELELRMSYNYLILTGGQCIRRNKLSILSKQDKWIPSLMILRFHLFNETCFPLLDRLTLMITY
jgi:hypothetical protein